VTLDDLNALPAAEAANAFRACCGARRWVDGMVSTRPFRSVDSLHAAADEIWWSLSPDDWRDAFAHHPRIGEQTSRRSAGVRAGQWSAAEQAGVGNDAEVRRRLADANAAYERRFGYIYIVCAAGKRADEMLALALERLDNAPEVELRVAAEEQRRITRLRLDKLLADEGP